MYSEPSPKAKMQTLGVVLLLVSGVMAVYLWLVHSENLWPQSIATIKSYECSYYMNSSGRRYTGSRSGYKLIIKYEYRAGDGLYTGESESGRYYSQMSASKAGDKLVGDQIMLHYNPTSPSQVILESVLAQNRPIAGLVLLAMAACALVGIVMLISSKV